MNLLRLNVPKQDFWNTKKHFSYLTGQVSFSWYLVGWLLHQEGKNMLGEFLLYSNIDRRILRNNLEQSVFYSILGVQCTQHARYYASKKQNVNHRLNCSPNATTSNKLPSFKNNINCEHCLYKNVVLTLLQNAIHTKMPILHDNH